MWVAVIVVAVLTVACIFGLVIEVGRDGYGSSPPPRSHPLDEFDPASGQSLRRSVPEAGQSVRSVRGRTVQQRPAASSTVARRLIAVRKIR